MSQAKTVAEEIIITDTQRMLQIAMLKALLSKNIINQPTYKKSLEEIIRLKEVA